MDTVVAMVLMITAGVVVVVVATEAVVATVDKTGAEALATTSNSN